VAAGTTFRLDTAELAMESGWHVQSTDHTDEFTRADVAITAHYSESDEIDTVVKRGPNGDHEDMADRTSGKLGLLRFWLSGGRRPQAGYCRRHDSARVASPRTPVTAPFF
jgi:hypothetical protein